MIGEEPVVDLACYESLQTPDDVSFAEGLSRTAHDVVHRGLMPPHGDRHDPVKGRVVLRCPPRNRRWRCVTPLDAGIGHAPHNLANAASDRTRVGLSPATIIISAAESDPIPTAWRRVGAAAIVIASSPSSWVSISPARESQRVAKARRACLVDAMVSSRTPGGRRAPQWVAAG